jgi:hypothetical protein
VTIAANLCLAVDAVHRVDAVIGDFQERNILVSDTSRVTLVDCDSMQFASPSGHRFLCAVARPEFTAPELAGVDLHSQIREQSSDLFALAVHIHQLPMAGNHPFLRGTWAGAGEQPDALSLANTGSWVGAPGSPLLTHPLAPPVTFLPNDIQLLFARALTDGARDPAARPTATEWRDALLRIKTAPCRAGLHQVPLGCYPCPWCTIENERRTRKRRVHNTPPPDQTIHSADSMKASGPTRSTSSAATPPPTSPPPPTAGPRPQQHRPGRTDDSARASNAVSGGIGFMTGIWPAVLAYRALGEAFGTNPAFGVHLVYYIAGAILLAVTVTLAVGAILSIRRNHVGKTWITVGSVGLICYTVVAGMGSSPPVLYISVLGYPHDPGYAWLWNALGIGLPSVAAAVSRRLDRRRL